MDAARAFALAAALATAALPASAFVATNSLTVRATGNGEFRVDFGGLTGDPDFWCAAGDYVYIGLRMPAGTRIFRTSPPPRHAGEGISFSLDPKNATDSGIITFGAKDKGLSAAAAQDLCDREPIFPRLLP